MPCRRHLAHPLATPGFSQEHAEPRYAPDLGLEPVHMHLDLRLDVFGRRLEGAVTLTLACRTRDWRKLTLDAVGFEDVSVEAEKGVGLDWRYDGDRLHLAFKEAIPVGETRRLTVRYRVTDPMTGLLFGGQEGDLGRNPVFAATDHETERARYWLPCVDHPSVRTTLEYQIRADGRLTALANGEELGQEEHEDGTRTTRWKLDLPCPSYLLCFAVGDFVRFDEGEHDGRPVAAFAPHPYTVEDLERSFGITRELLEWITAKLDSPLPWPKYFQFAVPSIGGAMENISLVSWDDAWVLDARLKDEIGHVVDFINLHEMAHTWFGDRIVCRDFAHSWLKESWATYMEFAWLEDRYGVETAQAQMYEELLLYAEEADGRYARPIVTRRFDSSWDLFDRHLYPGGAWRLHMLRNQLGNDTFWAGVRSYVARHAGRVVETDDFRRTLEEASGRSLARFFEQWLQSPGYPKLKAEWEHDPDDGTATLTIEQTQEDKEKHIELFHLDIEVEVEHEDGRFSRHEVPLRDRRAVLLVEAKTAPLQVILDPEMKLLFRLDFDPGQDLLKRTLEASSSVRGKLHAVETLARRGRPEGIAAVRAAYDREQHWHLRRLFARALGESGSPAAMRALVGILGQETDPRTLSAITDALGNYRDAAVGEALVAFIEGQDQPYRALAAALNSLGKQRGPAWKTEWLDLLERHARDHTGWWGWVQRGAISGLSEVEESRAVEILQSLLEDEQTRETVLPAVVEALGGAGRRQPRPARSAILDRLSDLVRHPSYAVRMAAGRAIERLGEREGTGALETLKQAVSVQHESTIDRHLRSLRKAGEAGATTKMEKRLEELTDQLGKLQERLDKLEAKGR